MAKIHNTSVFKVLAPVVQLLGRTASAFPGEGSAHNIWKGPASSYVDWTAAEKSFNSPFPLVEGKSTLDCNLWVISPATLD